jgi:hypothetical protein
LAHILISFGNKKLEQFYNKNAENINKAIEQKNYQLYDDIMG